MIDPKHGWSVSFKPQFLGFVSSLILVLAAYRIVTHYHLTNSALVTTLFILVIIQALLQLVFFLHIGLESKPHWSLLSFLFTVLVMVVIVGGTLWIMHHLNYNLMIDMVQHDSMRIH